MTTTTSTTTIASTSLIGSLEDVHTKKRRLTLDLSGTLGGGGPGATTAGGIKRPLLTSPDVRMLKLASPELERFILQQNGGALLTATPTPGGPYALASVLAGRPVTDEQESYARGFMDALQDLRYQEQHQHLASTCADSLHADCRNASDAVDNVHQLNVRSSALSAGPNSFYPDMSTRHLQRQALTLPQVKQEDLGEGKYMHEVCPVQQQVPVETHQSASQQVCHISRPSSASSSHVSDDASADSAPAVVGSSDDQHHLKLERKRMRNRIAATKCRHRKLERISHLEEQVEHVRRDNRQLHNLAASLRRQVDDMRREIVHHSRSGCRIALPTL